jgi:glycosyltransferase involved in cell wall biosynthesis
MARAAAVSRTPVSVLIPVRNEEQNLPDCLRHLQWASEIFVVDSSSTDDSVRLSERAGARVVQFSWDGQWPKKKNWALANLPFANDWVLIVDADERITDELAREITSAVQDPGDRVGYYINRRLIFMGRWIRHCGYYPSWNLRLVRRGRARYERLAEQEPEQTGDNEVHEHLVPDGPVGYLRSDMLHFAYPTIGAFVEKHNRYSTWEAHVEVHGRESALRPRLLGSPLERRRFWRRVSRLLPFRPWLRFLYGYVLRLGFLDGRPGLVLCRLLAYYEFLSAAKADEIRLEGVRGATDTRSAAAQCGSGPVK